MQYKFMFADLQIFIDNKIKSQSCLVPNDQNVMTYEQGHH